MGVLRAAGGGDVEVRTTVSELNALRSSGRGTDAPVANDRTILGIPAYRLGARITSEAVARLEMCVWKGKGVDRERVDGSWQAAFLERQPNDQQSLEAFWMAVEESMEYRNNAYVWVNTDPRTGRAVEWYALHPDQVAIFFRRNEKRFHVTVANGYVDPVGKGPGIHKVGTSTILHIVGPGAIGAQAAPTPVQLFYPTLDAHLAKIRHERNLFGRGATTPLILSFPEGVTAGKIREYREIWQETYEGTQNAGKTGVIGGGATPHVVGLTQADAEFVQAMNFSVEEIARIINVSPSLLGVATTDRPISPEHEESRFLRHNLNGRLNRLESAVRAWPSLFGPGARLYPRFDTNNVVRGDVMTEAEIDVKLVQAGIETKNERRRERGRPPLPGGDTLQETPVGGAQNQNEPSGGNAPAQEDEDDE